MKKLFLIQLVLTLTVLIFSSFNNRSSEYDIAAIYQGKVIDNAKVLTDDGVKDAEIILFPMQLNPGKYVVNLTRKGKDLYKIDGKEIYIQTRYCYEYASGQEVILDIESNYGYSLGKVDFK